MDNVYDGILFSEGHPSGMREIGSVEVLLDDQWFGGSQLKSLDDVKTELAKRVKEMGGNALIKFTYGQRSVGFWKSLVSIDDVCWWGKGMVAKNKTT